MKEMIVGWVRVISKLWNPPLMYALMIYYTWQRVIKDQAELIYSGTIDGVQYSLSISHFEWTTFERVAHVVMIVVCTHFVIETFPRWWKTIRRLNYNRVSRIG